jgi:hypothetical protein
MLGEAIAAAVVGLAALLLVMQPLLRRDRPLVSQPEPLEPEETPRGIALAALKEIDFDRETGKLSENDYQFLKAKYTGVALEALRAEEHRAGADPAEALIAARVQALRAADAQPAALRCISCGRRPEPDAVYCSTCGLRLESVAPVSPASPAPILKVIASAARNRPA